MNLLELAQKRCSIRKYASSPVEDEKLAYILEAGRMAPSDHMDIDVAIATEHISLAAAEQGLGSCWVCNFDTDLCRKHFNLPDTIEPAVILTIGYPESPDLFEQTSKKRKTLEEIIKEETF